MDIIRELKQERDRIDMAIRALEGTSGSKLGNARRRGRPPGRPPAIETDGPKLRRKGRRLSAAARKRISKAAKARWVKAKKAGKTSL